MRSGAPALGYLRHFPLTPSRQFSVLVAGSVSRRRHVVPFVFAQPLASLKNLPRIHENHGLSTNFADGSTALLGFVTR